MFIISNVKTSTLALWSVGCIAVAGFLIPLTGQAASISILANTKSSVHNVGEVFSVPVVVSTTADTPINAVSGVISFPTDLLQIMSVEKTGSIVEFWIDNPSFSNSQGTVNFEGGIYNPGFSGSGGKIITLVVRAKAAGSGSLSFLSSSVLANDGKGTNVLDKSNADTFVISGAGSNSAVQNSDTIQSDTVPTQVKPQSSLSSLDVTSSTHPDQAKWYSATGVDLSWVLPSGATSVRISFDKKPKSAPAVLYTSPISQKHIDVTEGIWYFHAQVRDANGWGPVSNFKISVDTTPPKAFEIKFPHGNTSTDPRPVALFTTTDELSGIDRYDVIIGEAAPISVSKATAENAPYAIPNDEPGQKTLKIIAYDKAGNTNSAVSSFTVLPLETVAFDTVPDVLTEGDAVQFAGVTYPKATVTVYLKDAQGNVDKQSIGSGPTGRFVLVFARHPVHGTYTMTAQVTDEHGAKSAMSPEKTIVIQTQPYFKFSPSQKTTMVLIVLFLIVVAACIAWTWYLTHSLRKFMRNLKIKLRKTDENVHVRFKKLHKVVLKQVRNLEKVKNQRELTVEEVKMIEALHTAIKEAEEEIEKDVIEIGS